MIFRYYEIITEDKKLNFQFKELLKWDVHGEPKINDSYIIGEPEKIIVEKISKIIKKRKEYITFKFIIVSKYNFYYDLEEAFSKADYEYKILEETEELRKIAQPMINKINDKYKLRVEVSLLEEQEYNHRYKGKENSITKMKTQKSNGIEYINTPTGIFIIENSGFIPGCKIENGDIIKIPENCKGD